MGPGDLVSCRKWSGVLKETGGNRVLVRLSGVVDAKPEKSDHEPLGFLSNEIVDYQSFTVSRCTV